MHTDIAHTRAASFAAHQPDIDTATSEAVPEGSFARAVLRHAAQCHESPEGGSRFLAKRDCLELLVNTALPGAEYLLVIRRDRTELVLAGGPDASRQLHEALTPRTVDGEIFHIRVQPGKVALAPVSELRAACIADIDWNLSHETVPSPGAPQGPLHIVRRGGHPLASGVIIKRSNRSSRGQQGLVGQLSIPAALCSLDKVRIWHMITSSAAEKIGRLVEASDEVTVNGMPSKLWLNALTCSADARMAQWLGFSPS